MSVNVMEGVWRCVFFVIFDIFVEMGSKVINWVKEGGSIGSLRSYEIEVEDSERGNSFGICSEVGR